MNVRVAVMASVLLGSVIGLGGCAHSPLARADRDRGPFLLDRPADTRGSGEQPEQVENKPIFPFNLFSKNGY